MNPSLFQCPCGAARPLGAVEPADQVDAMLAVVVFEVAIPKLTLHVFLESSIPTSLCFDDDLELVRFRRGRVSRHGVDVNIGPLASSAFRAGSPTNLHLSIDDNVSVGQVVDEVARDEIGEVLLLLWSPRFGWP